MENLSIAPKNYPLGVETKASKGGKNLELVRTKNNEGFEIFCYIVIDSNEHEKLCEKLEKGFVDLEKFGTVLDKGYGRTPHNLIEGEALLKFEENDF